MENKSEKNSPAKRNAGIEYTATGILIFLAVGSTIIALAVLIAIFNQTNQSGKSGGIPADSLITERMIVEPEKPYLIRDGKSMILIKPAPIGVSIYPRRSPPGSSQELADPFGEKRNSGAEYARLLQRWPRQFLA